jgi:hypothetical protein
MEYSIAFTRDELYILQEALDYYADAVPDDCEYGDAVVDLYSRIVEFAIAKKVFNDEQKDVD